MTPKMIRARMLRRGMTVPAFERSNGIAPGVVSQALRKRLPKQQKMIAEFLGKSLHDLWPQFYGPEGYVHPLAKLFGPEAFEAILARVEAGESVVAICLEPDQPGIEKVLAYRKEHPDFDVRMRRAIGRILPERKVAFVAALAKGSSIAAQSALSITTVYRLKRADPSFTASISGLYTPKPFRRLTDAERARRELERAARVSQRLQRRFDVQAVVEAAVRHVPSYARDDIRGDLMLALLEGRVSPEGARAATRQLMTAWNRQFARFDLSMDAEIGNGMTIAGLIADGSFDASGTGIRLKEAMWW